LVLVPGGLGDEHAFDPLVAHLTGRLRCLTIGRRGKGFSGDGRTYSYEREYEDIASVLDAVGPPRLVFGHSSGAICALGAALVSGVERLILVEPPLPLDGPGIDPEHHAAVNAAVKGGDAERALLIALRHALKLEPSAIESWRARADWPDVLRRGVAWLRELDEINRLPADVERYRAIQAPTLGSSTERQRSLAAAGSSRRSARRSQTPKLPPSTATGMTSPMPPLSKSQRQCSTSSGSDTDRTTDARESGRVLRGVV
jgi:alpha-beta hydrolase superfamily lysophospholipase